MITASAEIKITYEENGSRIKQIVEIIPDKKKNLKYFLNNKFVVGDKLENMLANFYIGDGEHIFFDQEVKRENKIIFLYNKKVKTKLNYKPTSFFVEGLIPNTEGCYDCVYFEENHKICKYFQKMNIKPRKKCTAFVQKRPAGEKHA